MNPLLKILTADEKQIAILTERYNHLKENMDDETEGEKKTRSHLRKKIAAIRKSKAVIVRRYLGKHSLETTEIDEIVNTHCNI